MAKIIRVWDGTEWQIVGAAVPDALSVDGIQTLTNKTISLANNTITGNITQFNSALSGADFATLAGSETFTNKTLTSPIISTISNTGVLTLPTSTDTLIGRATTDTLTNKSISGSTNTISNIGNSALTNSAITINGTSVSLGSSVNIVGETFNPFLLMGV